jgi:uncharacterized membrane protein YqhA
MNKITYGIESTLFRSRYLLAPLYLGLIGSLVAISVIELLKDFIELSGQAEVGGGTIWRVIIHLTFVVSGVLFAFMDWIADKRKFDGARK